MVSESSVVNRVDAVQLIEDGERVKHFYPIIIAIIALSVFCLFSRALCVDVFTRAESFYAEPAREMMAANKYLTVLFYNFTVFDKPILNYWCVITAFKIFGVSIFASRLPSILAGTSCLCMVALLSRKFYGERAALLATAALASSTLFLEMSASCMTDMLLTFLEFTAICLFFFATQSKGRQRILMCVGFGFFLGLGFLQKGLPAIVLPGLSIVAYSVLVRNQIKPSDVLIAFFTFAAAIAPWHIEVYKQQGMGPFYYLYIHEAVDRFCGKSQQYDFGHPPYYMFMALLSGLMPWSIFLPFAVVGLKTDWAKRRSTPSMQFIYLMATVSCVHLIFFTVSRSNWGYYNLPSFPGACILIGVYACKYLPMLSNKMKLPLGWIPALMFAGGILAAAYAAIFTWPAKAAIDPANTFAKALAAGPADTQFVSHKNLAGQYFYSDLMLFRTGKVLRYADDQEIVRGFSADKPFCAVVTQGYFNALAPALKQNLSVLRRGQMKYLNFPGCKLNLETPPNKQIELYLVCNHAALSSVSDHD